MAIPIKIKNINLIAEHNYKSKNSVCICDKELKDCTNKDDIYQGVCCHSYHKTCIAKYQMVDIKCPLCETQWVFNKNLTNNSIYLYKS